MNHTFTVTGMTCGHCEKAVTRAVKQLDPQAEVTITGPPTGLKWCQTSRARRWPAPSQKRATRLRLKAI